MTNPRAPDPHVLVELDSGSHINVKAERPAQPDRSASCSTDHHSSRLVLLRIVDSQPSLWPHANKHVPDQVACVFDVRVAQLRSEISMREGASIPLKVCPFDRDDRPSTLTYLYGGVSACAHS